MKKWFMVLGVLFWSVSALGGGQSTVIGRHADAIITFYYDQRDISSDWPRNLVRNVDYALLNSHEQFPRDRYSKYASHLISRLITALEEGEYCLANEIRKKISKLP